MITIFNVFFTFSSHICPVTQTTLLVPGAPHSIKDLYNLNQKYEKFSILFNNHTYRLVNLAKMQTIILNNSELVVNLLNDIMFHKKGGLLGLFLK